MQSFFIFPPAELRRSFRDNFMTTSWQLFSFSSARIPTRCARCDHSDGVHSCLASILYSHRFTASNLPSFTPSTLRSSCALPALLPRCCDQCPQWWRVRWYLRKRRARWWQGRAGASGKWGEGGGWKGKWGGGA